MYGFKVTAFLADRIQYKKDYFLEHPDEWSFLFSEVSGNLLLEGEIMRRPALARTLQKIAGEDGVSEFYNGSIAENLARAAQNAGGIITKEDFAEFFTVETDTVKTTVFGKEFVTCPDPCRWVPRESGGPRMLMFIVLVVRS